MVSDPKLCGEFIARLEQFMDAKQYQEQFYESKHAAKEAEKARHNLMEFIEQHFELK